MPEYKNPLAVFVQKKKGVLTVVSDIAKRWCLGHYSDRMVESNIILSGMPDFVIFSSVLI